MKIYKDEIQSNYKALSKTEQRELYNKMREGCVQSRDEIIFSCLPLVYSIAQKFQANNKHVELEDMIQTGNIALMKTVEKWDIEKSNITTLATYCVRNALIDMIKDGKYGIVNKFDITRHAAKDIIKIKATRSTDIEEIKKETGLKEQRIKSLLTIMKSKRVYATDENFRSIENSCKPYIDRHEEDENERGYSKCLVGLVEMVEKNIDNNKDKEIFLCWIKNVNKNNKTRIVAGLTNSTVEEVVASVKSCKTKLKEIAKCI